MIDSTLNAGKKMTFVHPKTDTKILDTNAASNIPNISSVVAQKCHELVAEGEAQDFTSAQRLLFMRDRRLAYQYVTGHAAPEDADDEDADFNTEDGDDIYYSASKKPIQAPAKRPDKRPAKRADAELAAMIRDSLARGEAADFASAQKLAFMRRPDLAKAYANGNR